MSASISTVSITAVVSMGATIPEKKYPFVSVQSAIRYIFPPWISGHQAETPQQSYQLRQPEYPRLPPYQQRKVLHERKHNHYLVHEEEQHEHGELHHFHHERVEYPEHFFYHQHRGRERYGRREYRPDYAEFPLEFFIP